MSTGTPSPARRVLITGAGRGIGRATAVTLAAGGARVFGVSRTASELEALASVAPVEILACSIGDPAGCREVAGEAVERLGGVDVLIHCAGVDTHRERPIWEQDATVWADTMTVNGWAAFELARLLAGGMVARGWGRIVMVASTAGTAGGPASTAYCAAKHAVVGLVRAAALDLAPHRVTCNAVLPGWVRGTGMSDVTMQMTARRDGITVAEAWDRVERDTPGGRVATPDEVAAAIAFLASEDAGAITGELIRVAHGSLW